MSVPSLGFRFRYHPGVFLALAGLVFAPLVQAETPTTPNRYLQPGDTWVALGDSITENGQAQTWIEYYFLARLGASSFHAINAGIGGDTAWASKKRLSWDVLSNKPTIVTVMFGMNDVGRHLYDPAHQTPETLAQREQSLKNYETNLSAVVRELRRDNLPLILLTPTPFEHTAALQQPDLPGVDAALGRCAEIVHKTGEKEKIPVIDLHVALGKLNEDFKEKYPERTLIGPDRIHPGALGQFAVAVSELEAMGLGNISQRANVDERANVDAGSLRGEGEGIGAIRKESDGWKFEVQFAHLPLVAPIPDAPKPWLDRLKDGLGSDLLHVSRLPEGNYRLRAEGMDCGTFSAKQWADGIALAGLASFPLTQQSEKLLGLLRAKAAESAKLRVIAWSEDIAFPEGRPDVIAIDDVEKRLQALQQKSTPGFATAVQNRLSRYRQCKEQELDIRQHMKALEAEAATLSVVPKIHIEVQPVVAEGK